MVSLYQLTIEQPNDGGKLGVASAFTYAAGGRGATITLSQYDFGSLPAYRRQRTQISSRCIQRINLASRAYRLPAGTIQVISVPAWLSSAFLPTTYINSRSFMIRTNTSIR